MQNVAIIPARGGSKRIPKKNIKDFMGKPIISYAIEACINSEIFDEVMVSTDSDEISAVAKSYGANVPFLRSPETSGDYATTFDVLEEVIKMYAQRGQHFENVCCVYPCAPFLKANTLKEANKKFIGHIALVAVCKYPVPIEWAMRIESGVLVPDNKKAQDIRSQDLGPKYFDAGMFYFCKTKVLMDEKTLIPSNTIPYELSDLEVQDIDNLEDWKIAEFKYRYKLNNSDQFERDK